MFAVFATNFIIALLITNSVATLNKDLIIGFFKYKNIRVGYIFDCLSIKEKMAFAKFLMGNGLRISESYIKQQNLALINNKNSHFQHGIIVDGDCDNLDNLLETAEIHSLFDDTYHWLIVASNDNFFIKFSNVSLNINSDLYVVTPHIKNHKEMENWALNDVYNPAYNNGGELKIANIGFYTKSSGFQVNRRGYKYWARRNMTGVTLKAMTVLRQPFEAPLEEYLECNNNRRKDSFTRFQYRLTRHCQELYNFSLKISMTETWGYEYEKGKFDGLVGAVQRKEVDFGCSALYVKPERMPIVDYATGLWEFKEIIVFRQPQCRSFAQVFLHPLETSAWLATLAAAVLIVMALKVNQRYELNFIKNVKNSLDQTWSTSILFTLGIFCQQGSPQTPILPGGRIVTMSILTFCVLFYQFYSGSIISLLLTKPAASIITPEDLLTSSLKVGSDDAPYIRDFFQTTTDPIAIELYQRKMLDSGISTNYYLPEEGLKLVEKGGFAYQVEITAAYIIIQDTFSEKAICELGEVQIFPTKRLMTVLQKNSPFRDMFNYCMLRLAEHGIGAYQKAYWGAQKPDCLESSSSVSIEVNLKEIYPAIALLFIGIVVSLTILGFEILSPPNNKGIRKRKKLTKFEYQYQYTFHN